MWFLYVPRTFSFNFFWNICSSPWKVSKSNEIQAGLLDWELDEFVVSANLCTKFCFFSKYYTVIWVIWLSQSSCDWILQNLLMYLIWLFSGNMSDSIYMSPWKRCHCHEPHLPSSLVPSRHRLGLGLLVPAQDRPAGWKRKKSAKERANLCVFSFYVCK